jgi:hypothetical protein
MNTPRGRPFPPGNTAGRGRPKGSRNKATRVAQQLLDQHSEPIVRKCIIEAMHGNVHALKLCMERLTPARRENPVRMQLPRVVTAGDVGLAQQKVLEAIASGRITPLEGESIANTLEKRRKGIETVELLARVEQLERAAEERAKRAQS